MLYDPPRGRRPEGPGTDHAFLQAWFRFMAAHYAARGQWKSASEAIATGRAQIGDDPDLLLADGALQEIAWRMEHDEGRSVPYHGDLGEAETALARALEIDPALDEARLRLGRVQAKHGKGAAALQTLAQLRAGTTEAAFVYLARLFEGDVYDGLGDFEKAEQAYQAAIAIMPEAESAQIALAHLLHAAGRRDEALQRVTALVSDARVEARKDPWLLYEGGVAWRGPNYLNALKALVHP